MFDKLDKNNKYIIALSGGPDSVYLLYKLINEGFKNLVCVHINHNIRKNSKKDELFCKKLCNDLKIPIYTISLNIPKKAIKKNLEEVARIERYKYLEKIRQKENAQNILTAHNQDDLIETFFLNILRGCSINGLNSLQYKNGYILRPLLNISKKEIIETCQKNNWDFVIDETNYDIKYSRNFLRHKIIPLFENIQNYNPQNILNLSSKINEINDFINNFVIQKIDEIKYDKNIYDLEKFLSLHSFIQKEIIYHIYQEIYGNRLNLYESHLNQIISILNKKKSNTKKELGNKAWIKVIKKDKKKFIFIDKK